MAGDKCSGIFDEWWDAFETDIQVPPYCFQQSYCLTCWWYALDDAIHTKAEEHKFEHPGHKVRSTG